MTTTTGPMTIEQFAEIHEDGRFDLIRGELITMSPAGGRHGRIALVISGYFYAQGVMNGLGEGFTAEASYVLSRGPHTVVCPDVSFVRTDRLPPDDDRDGFMQFAPDIAVEVVSPTDLATNVNAKVAVYLHASARLIWIVDSATRTVIVYSPTDPTRFLDEKDTLDGGDVLPGFSLPLTGVFSY